MAAKTTAALVAAKRKPPSAGPSRPVRVATVPEATFAAVSSSGVRARAGRAAACAGWNAVDGHRRHAGQGVDRPGRAVERCRSTAIPASDAARTMSLDHHHAHPRKAVGQEGQRRRGDRPEQEAHQAERADRRRAAGLECVDADARPCRARRPWSTRPRPARGAGVRGSGRQLAGRRPIRRGAAWPNSPPGSCHPGKGSPGAVGHGRAIMTPPRSERFSFGVARRREGRNHPAGASCR